MYIDARERRFQRFAMAVMLLTALICIIPFVLMLSASLTSEAALNKGGYRFWPAEFSFDSYKYLWQRRNVLLRSYAVSIGITLIGTVGSVCLTTLMAYPLSRPSFKYRNIVAFFVFFTMIFNGGATASYIIWTRIFKLKNTFAALLLPNLFMSGFNILLVRNFYTNSIPYEILEAAKLDGASEFCIFSKIALPLAKPVVATITLFTGLAYWNDWINGMYYISDTEYYNINVYLTKLMNNIDMLRNASNLYKGGAAVSLPAVGIRMAIAIVALLPILVLYPILQKHLIQGMVIGGVKG